MRSYAQMLCIFSLILVPTCVPANAQTKIEEGSTELAAFGVLLFDSSDNASFGQAGFTYGRFLPRNFEVGVTISTILVKDDLEDSFTAIIGPFARYNFLNKHTMPFVGIGVWTLITDDDAEDEEGDEGFALNFEIGSRFSLSDNVAFTVTGSYLYDIEENEFASFFSVGFGISYIFSRK